MSLLTEICKCVRATLSDCTLSGCYGNHWQPHPMLGTVASSLPLSVFSHSIPFSPCASHVYFPLCRSGFGTNASETQGVVGNLFCYCLRIGRFSSCSSNDNNKNFISMQRDTFAPGYSFVRIFFFFLTAHGGHTETLLMHTVKLNGPMGMI